jgi:gamma-aminobutyric acid type B receptor
MCHVSCVPAKKWFCPFGSLRGAKASAIMLASESFVDAHLPVHDKAADSPAGRYAIESPEVYASDSGLESKPYIARNGTRRRAHLVSILSLSDRNASELEPFRVLNEVATWLAFHHLRHPELHILPDIGPRLLNCDIDFSLTMYDDQYQQLRAARQLSELFYDVPVSESANGTSEQVFPIALLGSVRTRVSSILSVLSSSYGIPQISSSSTSTSLDNKEIHPLFARTVPNNKGDALAVVSLLQSFNVTHFAVLYINDDFGSYFHADVIAAANNAGLQVRSFGYKDDGRSIGKAIRQLGESQLQYVVGILSSNFKPVVKEAAQAGLMNATGMTWFLTQASSPLADEGVPIKEKEDEELAVALNGTGIVRLRVDMYEPFRYALRSFAESRALQRLYVDDHENNSPFEDFEFKDRSPDPYTYLAYDAMIALGIAACEVPTDEFTGQELYDQLRKTKFRGVSGPVSFDSLTGTRNPDDFKFEVKNLLVSPGDLGKFSNATSYVIDLSKSTAPDRVEMHTPFVFAYGGTAPPAPLPPLEMDNNLIPDSVRFVGCSMAVLVMIISSGWIYWTWRYRNKDVVRSSQPIFLWQLCTGTILIASSIIPMSMQESDSVSQSGLNAACNIIPWLLSIGFVTAWSAIFAKTWRLNRVMKQGHSCRRVKVSPVDVMLPFFAMLAVNLAVLLAWTLKAPLEWVRVELANFDDYGRATESYGTCRRSGSNRELWHFLGPILGINLIAFVITICQCYEARDLHSDYSEASSLFTSMGCLLETLVVGAPLVFVASENPTTQFLIRSILLFIVCLTILVPVFVPKYIRRTAIQQERTLQAASIKYTPVFLSSKSSFLGGAGSESRNEHPMGALVPSSTRNVEDSRASVVGNAESVRGSVRFGGLRGSVNSSPGVNNRGRTVPPLPNTQNNGSFYQSSSSGPMALEFRMSAARSSGLGPHASSNSMLTAARQVQRVEEAGNDENPTDLTAGTSRVSRSDAYFTHLASQQLLHQSGGRRPSDPRRDSNSSSAARSITASPR